MSRTRTYKLRLSHEGFEHFLHCHHRLAALSGELIPYGATLYASVALLDAMAPQDIAAEADVRSCMRLAGSRSYFVGFSVRLAELVVDLRQRVAGIATDLPVARLYLLGLVAFASADDDEIVRAYRTYRANGRGANE